MKTINSWPTLLIVLIIYTWYILFVHLHVTATLLLPPPKRRTRFEEKYALERNPMPTFNVIKFNHGLTSEYIIKK